MIDRSIRRRPGDGHWRRILVAPDHSSRWETHPHAGGMYAIAAIRVVVGLIRSPPLPPHARRPCCVSSV
jgi:hypothetical protein